MHSFAGFFAGNCTDCSSRTPVWTLEICWPEQYLRTAGLGKQLGMWLLCTWSEGSWSDPWGSPQSRGRLRSVHWFYRPHESGWWHWIWSWVILDSSPTWRLPKLFYC